LRNCGECFRHQLSHKSFLEKSTAPESSLTSQNTCSTCSNPSRSSTTTPTKRTYCCIPPSHSQHIPRVRKGVLPQYRIHNPLVSHSPHTHDSTAVTTSLTKDIQIDRLTTATPKHIQNVEPSTDGQPSHIPLSQHTRYDHNNLSLLPSNLPQSKTKSSTYPLHHLPFHPKLKTRPNPISRTTSVLEPPLRPETSFTLHHTIRAPKNIFLVCYARFGDGH
jgi:hypothetical protein